MIIDIKLVLLLSLAPILSLGLNGIPAVDDIVLSDGGPDADASDEQPILLEPTNRARPSSLKAYKIGKHLTLLIDLDKSLDKLNNQLLDQLQEDDYNEEPIEDLVVDRKLPLLYDKTNDLYIDPKSIDLDKLSNGLDWDWDQERGPSDELTANWYKSVLSDGSLDTLSADQPLFLQPSNRDLSDDLSSSDADYGNDIWDVLQDINTDDSDDDGLVNDPSFPRQHRYDTKKPGPGYYMHELDSQEPDPNLDRLLAVADKSESRADADDLKDLGVTGGGQKERIHVEERPLSYLLNKKSTNQAYKPVSEGPVKVETESADGSQKVIVSAEDGETTRLEAIDTSYAYVIVDPPFTDEELQNESDKEFVESLERLVQVPKGTFSNVRTDQNRAQITFKVNPNAIGLNASLVAQQIEDLPDKVSSETSRKIVESGIGYKTKLEVLSLRVQKESLHRLTTLTLTLCGLIMVALVSGVLLFFYRRNEKFRQKLHSLANRSGDLEASQDYQDLCRQRMQNKSNEKQEPINVAPTAGTGVHSTTKLVSKLSQQSSDGAQASPPSRSSTSSWNEEPVASNMDISTGHIILSYMEDHLKKKDRLDREWEALCAYEADPCSTNAASLPQNAKKNRFPDVLPYDHSRVILNDLANISSSDYINANTITDHDPRNPAYIATQGPLPQTSADFWQMIWEQGSVIIVMLTRLMENGVAMCHRYWPEEGSELYHNYEVHLVSEHIWCDDYLVRSFYLKNLKTSETRTVTQFHFLSWPENGVPPNAKSILEFRRKVNKSYRGRSCPIVVHCSDGTGRTGTYISIDMVLNRMSKGAKEIDIAATLEHIRDQRMAMVKTKAQFEYVLTAVAEEVQAILKALAQN